MATFEARGRSGVNQRAIVVRVDAIEPAFLKKTCQPPDQAGLQTRGDLQGGDRPTQIGDLLSQRPLVTQGKEVQGKTIAVGMAGEFHQ